MRRGALAIAVTLAALAGCGRSGTGTHAGAPAGPSSVVQAGPVEVNVRASGGEVRTVDRVDVRVRATAEPGARIDAIEIDPEGAGWTLVSRVDRPLAYDEAGRASREVELRLEPFLDGDYEVPPATVSWTDAAGETGTTSSDPIAVKVTSVLDAGDKQAAFVEARGLLEPAPPAEQTIPTAVVVGAVAAVTLGAGAVIWLVARSRPRHEPDPLAELRRITAKDTAPDDEAFAAVERAIWRSRVSSPALDAIRSECERVRYGRVTPAPGRGHELARETLRELEGAAP